MGHAETHILRFPSVRTSGSDQRAVGDEHAEKDQKQVRFSDPFTARSTETTKRRRRVWREFLGEGHPGRRRGPGGSGAYQWAHRSQQRSVPRPPAAEPKHGPLEPDWQLRSIRNPAQHADIGPSRLDQQFKFRATDLWHSIAASLSSKVTRIPKCGAVFKAIEGRGAFGRKRIKYGHAAWK